MGLLKSSEYITELIPRVYRDEVWLSEFSATVSQHPGHQENIISGMDGQSANPQDADASLASRVVYLQRFAFPRF